jgi:integrase/recombinase XerD
MIEYKQDCPQLVKDFLNYQFTIKGSSQGTIVNYYSDLMIFIKYFSKNKAENFNINDLKRITLDDLYNFMFFLANDNKCKAPTRARKTSSIKSFYKYLHIKVKLLDENVVIGLELPKLDKLQPKYLSVEESEHLLTSVYGTYLERDYCIINLFLNCGMRLSELCGIDIPDIRDNKLTIFGKGSKERIIVLNNSCLDSIQRYLPVREKSIINKDALFISRMKNRISTSMVEKLVKKYLKLAGLDVKRYSVHKLRHSCGTMLYQATQDIKGIQELLGHSSILSTSIYTHSDISRMEKLVNSNPLGRK